MPAAPGAPSGSRRSRCPSTLPNEDGPLRIHPLHVRPQLPPHDIVIGTASTLADEFARRIALEARVAVGTRRRFALALPGGSIARTFVPVLAAAPLPWES